MPEICPHEKRLDTIEKRNDGIVESLRQMENKFDAKLDMILMQLNKVAILEEKHSYQSAALERAFNKITTLDTEFEELVKFKSHVEGMARMAYIIWGAMGVSIVAMLSKVYGG